MATVIVHPDYINFQDPDKARIDEYSVKLYEKFLKYFKNEYENRYWNTIPRELAQFFKKEYYDIYYSNVNETTNCH